MEKNFIRVRSAKDIIISSTLTITGSVLIALPTGTAINIVGFILIITGIILFLALHTGYKDEESGVKYCKTERYFSQEMRPALIEKICSAPNEINLSEEDKGNAVRLDIYHSKATGKAYIQVFEYIPYKYEPCSRQFEHEIASVSKIK